MNPTWHEIAAEREAALEALSGTEPSSLTEGILGLALGGAPPLEVGAWAARLLDHGDADVRAAAVHALGHCARVHGVAPAVAEVLLARARIDLDPRVRAAAVDADDDIGTFTGHRAPVVSRPFRVPGTGDKIIEEHVGRASTGEGRLSVAHMRAPAGWSEPGQRPRFDEWTVVLRGAIVVEHVGGRLVVEAGQAVRCAAGEWVRYSTPDGPAEYVAVCLPAFTLDGAQRDPE